MSNNNFWGNLDSYSNFQQQPVSFELFLIAHLVLAMMFKFILCRLKVHNKTMNGVAVLMIGIILNSLQPPVNILMYRKIFHILL